MAKRIIAHKDNASGQLNVGISAATLTIPLKSGEGALFPTTYAGAATSGGSSTALNDTGIGASGIAVRDIIENVTDGSFAVVTQVNTNDIVTTPLIGGSDNTWQSADVWAVNRFVVTAIQYDTDGTTILKREKMLIDSRSGDNLTVNASGRGYDGSSAQSFLADDYVYQFAMAASFEGIYEAFKELAIQVDALIDEVDTKLDITNAQTHAVATSGSDAYVAAYSPVISAYVDGMLLTFEADVANAGTATFNAGAGAYTIKKNFNQTLATDDIKVGQKVDVRWDASNSVWQMQSQIGNVPPTGSDYNQYPFTAGEALLQGDHVGITAADTIKRYSPTAIPATFDQMFDLAGTFDYATSARAGVLVSLSTSLKAFAYNDQNSATPGMGVIRIPITPSTGAVGTLSGQVNIVSGFTPPVTIDAVDMGSNRVLMVESKSNAFSYVVADMSSSISLGTSASIDTSNVEEGFCEYISDSHVLFFSRDSSSASIQFYKYTASGTTLTASSTGTVITLTGKTFYLKGVRRFGTTNYFLFLVQNDTDGTAQAIIAEYNTGSSTFSTVGTVTNFGGGQDLYNVSGAQAVMANLDDTHIMVRCATSITDGVTFLVSRTNSTSTTPVFGTFNTYTGGSNHGYSITKGNARCAFACSMNGTTATIQLWEVNADGTDIVLRTSTTLTDAPSNSTMESNGLCAAFPVNPKRMGFIGFDGGADDIGVGTGEYTLPPSAGITAAAIANGDSGNVVTGGYCDDVSGLTAAQRYYADLAGLLTIVSDGSPDKVGCTKDATELIIKSW